MGAGHQYNHVSQEWRITFKEYAAKNPKEALELFEEMTQTKINLPTDITAQKEDLLHELNPTYYKDKVLQNALNKLEQAEFSHISKESKEYFKASYQQNPIEAMKDFEKLTNTRNDKEAALRISVHTEKTRREALEPNKPMVRELAMLFKQLDSTTFAQTFNKDPEWIRDFKNFAQRHPTAAFEIYTEQTGINIPQTIAIKDAEIAKAATLEKQRHETFCSSVDKAAFQYEQLLTQRDDQQKNHKYGEASDTERKLEKVIDTFAQNPQMIDRLKSHHQETAQKIENALQERQLEMQRVHTRGMSMDF